MKYSDEWKHMFAWISADMDTSSCKGVRGGWEALDRVEESHGHSLNLLMRLAPIPCNLED